MTNTSTSREPNVLERVEVEGAPVAVTTSRMKSMYIVGIKMPIVNGLLSRALVKFVLLVT
jgi:hypothetical protein